MLAAAGVVEVVSRKRRAPVLEHSLQTSLGNMRYRHVLRHVSEAETGQCRIEHLARAVQHELAFDARVQFATTFLEFPCVEPAVGGQAQVDAVVLDQILRGPYRQRARAS